MKILIADHDVAGREVIGAGVRLAWPDSTLVLVSTVTAAIRAADEEEPDIVVLAADLGGRDGLAVVRATQGLRRADPRARAARRYRPGGG